MISRAEWDAAIAAIRNDPNCPRDATDEQVTRWAVCLLRTCRRRFAHTPWSSLTHRDTTD